MAFPLSRATGHPGSRPTSLAHVVSHLENPTRDDTPDSYTQAMPEDLPTVAVPDLNGNLRRFHHAVAHAPPTDTHRM